MSQYKTKAFKALQKEWYGKLKEAHFEDIEDVDSPREMLHCWHSQYFQGHAQAFEEVSSYYRGANSVLEHFEFPTLLEKDIWTLHAKGLSIRKIAHALEIKNHTTVHYHLSRLKKAIAPKMDNISVNLVEVRPGKIDDENLIYATWLRPLYYDNDLFGEIERGIFFQNYHQVVSKLLKKPHIVIQIACLREDSDVILGYSVLEGEKLHWVYVKKAWRQLGIAKKLIPEGTKTFTHATQLALQILKHRGWTFNPFL